MDQGRANNAAKVSVVILTYNRREKLRSCLQSIIASRYSPLEIIVIDDGSVDDTNLLIAGSYPQCRYIRHQTPQLTGVGINEGIRASTGALVLIVDDDNVLAPDAISEIVSTFSSSPKVGVVGPICYYLSKPETIMYAGARLSPISRRAILIGHRKIDRGQFTEATPVEMFPNCFALRREFLIDQPLVDTQRLPFFNDDASLQMAIARRGYHVVLNPRARTWHDYPYSAGEERTWNDPFRTYYTVRSKIFLERGYDNPRGQLTFSLCYLGYIMTYLAKILSMKGPWSTKKACLSALRSAIWNGLLDNGGSARIQ